MATNHKSNEEMTDHDLLIRLDEKVTSLTLAVNEMNDGIRARLRNLEVRVDAEEKIHDRVQPIEALERLEKIEMWVRDFQIRWKTVITIASGTGAIVGFILSLLSGILGISSR